MPIGAALAALAGNREVRRGVGRLLGGLFGRRRRRRSPAPAPMPSMAAVGPDPAAVVPAPVRPLPVPTPSWNSPASPGGVLPTIGDAANWVSSRLNNQLGGVPGMQQVPVVRHTGLQSQMGADQIIELLGRRSSTGRRALADMLYTSGALHRAGFIKPPIRFIAANGMEKNGSDPGWIIIRKQVGGQTVTFQMPKFLAQNLGFWKPRKKPVISVRDSEAIKRASRAKGRVKDLVKMVDKDCKPVCPPRRRSTPSNTSSTRSRARK